jgi:hypothetical protein
MCSSKELQGSIYNKEKHNKTKAHTHTDHLNEERGTIMRQELSVTEEKAYQDMLTFIHSLSRSDIPSKRASSRNVSTVNPNSSKVIKASGTRRLKWPNDSSNTPIASAKSGKNTVGQIYSGNTHCVTKEEYEAIQAKRGR